MAIDYFFDIKTKLSLYMSLNYNFIAAVDFLEIASHGTIGYQENFFLTDPSDPIIKERFPNKQFFDRIGAINGDKLLTQPCLYTWGVYSDLQRITQKTNIVDILPYLMFWFTQSTHAFWFVKDNNCAPSTGIVQLGYADNVMFFTTGRLITNSKGEANVTSFSDAEFTEASKINLKYWDYVTQYPVIPEPAKYGFTTGQPVMSGVNLNYGDENQNRIERANGTLMIARESTNLIQKIAFYVAAFECLFITKDKFIKETLGERVTFYAGGDGATQATNKALLLDAYKVRSTFFHGSANDKKHAQLQQMSVELDNLFRQVFVKIIMEDSVIFLLKKPELKKWFKDNM